MAEKWELREETEKEIERRNCLALAGHKLMVGLVSGGIGCQDRYSACELSRS